MAISIIEHNSIMTTKVVGAFKEVIPVAAGFSQWFPEETTPSLEVDVTVQRGSRKISVDVERFTEGRATKMPKVTANKYIPPYHELEYYFNRDEVFMKLIQYGALGSPEGGAAIAQNAFDNLNEQRKMIQRAIQKQQSDILQTGIITLKNGDNIDFKRKPASMINVNTAGNPYWSNPTTAKPLDDLAKGGLFLRQIGTASGNELNFIARSSVIAALMNTDQYKSFADYRRIDRLQVGMPQFTESTGFTYHGQIAAGTDYRVNLWSYDEFYEDEDEKSVYYLSDKLGILLPMNFQGKTVFGGLYGLKNSSIGGASTKIPALIETDYLIRPFYDEKTVSSGIIQSSAPIVIPITVDRIFSLQVIA